jgi:low temperature requirement protein LtrA
VSTSLQDSVGPDPIPAADEALGEFEQERRTTPVELLWDLVFVFAVTQVTTLLSKSLTWAGFGRSMLVLALVWWAWSAFVWAANAQRAESSVLLAVLLGATACILVAGIALPHAFGANATLFAGSYAAVRGLHLLLYADASRRGNASWSAIAGFGVTVAVGMALLLAGSFLSEGPRLALWGSAAAIDYAGPGLLTRARLRGLQRVSVAHFAERYGLFVIIALGESIVAVGVRSRTTQVDVRLVVAVALCLLITVGLWWTYFDRFARMAEERLRRARDPVLAASDAYSYLHLVIIAGIIVFAVGARLVVGGTALGDAGWLALCGGVSLYLVGLLAAGWRLIGSFDPLKVVAALVLLAVGLWVPPIASWGAAAIVTGVLAVVCVVDAVRLVSPR